MYKLTFWLKMHSIILKLKVKIEYKVSKKLFLRQLRNIKNIFIHIFKKYFTQLKFQQNFIFK